YQAGINKAFHQPEGTLSDSTQRRIDSAVDEMVRYMLFVDETPILAPIKGVSGFTKTFPARGPRDSKGRSLRDFDLTKRIFRHPLSYMIYSKQFDGMPAEARSRIYRRLYDVLTGQDKSGKYDKLSAEDRRDIFEILRDTKKGLPPYWTTEARAGY
ncbi:MAG: hypothetical protein IT167_21430, partial [Bryobacterales bacterium]|nr:hypothetical protein [Bryobacterales bacterium]